MVAIIPLKAVWPRRNARSHVMEFENLIRSNFMATELLDLLFLLWWSYFSQLSVGKIICNSASTYLKTDFFNTWSTSLPFRKYLFLPTCEVICVITKSYRSICVNSWIIRNHFLGNFEIFRTASSTHKLKRFGIVIRFGVSKAAITLFDFRVSLQILHLIAFKYQLVWMLKIEIRWGCWPSTNEKTRRSCEVIAIFLLLNW